MKTKKRRSSEFNVACWNVEDFSNINNLYKDKVFQKIQSQDIIMIQEWKNKNYEGDLFLHKLNNNTLKYTINSVDRVSTIYNTNLFDPTKTIVYPILLCHEDPILIEKTYTTGRKKYNMLSILYPKDSNLFPVCVINFHLNAYSPIYHPGFHKKQLQNLIEEAIKKIKKHNISKFGLIVGGDTNYRNLGITSDNLLELLSQYKDLHDVCKKKCLHQKTHSFYCAHERDIAKQTARVLRKYIYTREGVPKHSLHDNRLDFIATNLQTDYNYTKVINLCQYSDHSLILSRMSWKIN